MTAAFGALATKHPEHRDQWISDDKWIDVIWTSCFAPPPKEKERESTLDRNNVVVQAVGSRWQRATEDFTPTNQSGAF